MHTQFLTTVLVVVSSAAPSHAQQKHELGRDSQRQENVPRGNVTTHTLLESKVYPGTKRRFYVYTPAQYQPSEPAGLMVFQDGHSYVDEQGSFRVPIVFDNLINANEMPVTVAVFVDPGHTGPLPESPGWEPYPGNRSVEYDTLSDNYARFLLNEILPQVEKSVALTDDPNRRAICGISSGGICAFTVAWQRPDQFRKVMSHIGSFVNIRGGHIYPALIRKQKPEKKPLRIFLQDGANDLDNEHGNWPLANQQMAKALEFARYDFHFEFGDGKHDGQHGGAIFPDSIRWLWQDWDTTAEAR